MAIILATCLLLHTHESINTVLRARLNVHQGVYLRCNSAPCFILENTNSTLATSCGRVDSLEKTGRDWEQEEKGTAEDEMAGWHHQLDGREFE